MRQYAPILVLLLLFLVILPYFDHSAGVRASALDSQNIPSYGSVSYNGSIDRLTYLHVEGNKVKNVYGETVYLRGVDKFSFYEDEATAPGWNHIVESDVENIKNLMNANIIRCDISVQSLFPTFNFSQPNTAHLQMMDNFVGWCAERKIYVLFCMFGYYMTYNMADGYPDDFWTNPIRQQNVREFYIFLAEHYKGQPAVFGFDIMNEPANGWAPIPTLERWKVFATDVMDGFQAVNPTLIAVVETLEVEYIDSLWWVKDSPINRPNVVYSGHIYAHWAETSQWMDHFDFARAYRDGRYEEARTLFDSWLDERYHSEANVPFYIGEFGTYYREDNMVWLEDLLQIMGERGWSWTAFLWHTCSGAGAADQSYNLVDYDWVTLRPQGELVSEYA